MIEKKEVYLDKNGFYHNTYIGAVKSNTLDEVHRILGYSYNGTYSPHHIAANIDKFAQLWNDTYERLELSKHSG
jgi:hypothetical protein